MVNSEYNQLVIDLSRDIVAQTAPEELPLYRAISAAYSKNPEKTLRGQTGKDEDLGFGVTETTQLLTPVVFSVMSVVVEFLADEILESYKKENPEAIKNLIKNMFKRHKPAQDKRAPSLTSEQLVRVRQHVLEKIRQLGLSDDQARLLADSIVGSLVAAP